VLGGRFRSVTCDGWVLVMQWKWDMAKAGNGGYGGMWLVRCSSELLLALVLSTGLGDIWGATGAPAAETTLICTCFLEVLEALLKLHTSTNTVPNTRPSGRCIARLNRREPPAHLLVCCHYGMSTHEMHTMQMPHYRCIRSLSKPQRAHADVETNAVGSFVGHLPPCDFDGWPLADGH
jgi:hypothetical protein